MSIVSRRRSGGTLKLARSQCQYVQCGQAPELPCPPSRNNIFLAVARLTPSNPNLITEHDISVATSSVPAVAARISADAVTHIDERLKVYVLSLLSNVLWLHE